MHKQRAPANAQTLADDIRSALAPETTCTPATVAQLQSLLSIEYDADGDKENDAPGRARRGAAVKPKSTGSTRTKTKGALRVEVEEESEAAARKRRFLLATDVVNVGLKILAGALKNGGKATNVKDVAQLSEKTGRASKPLQSRAVSQTSNTARSRPTIRRTDSQVSEVPQENGGHVKAVAECCRLAFAHLRSVEVRKHFAKDLPVLQVEQGMLSLIGKLVGHGLANMALKEMQVLRKRLQQYVGGEERAVTKSEEVKEKNTLAALIDIKILDKTSVAIPAVISYQIHVLKLFAGLKRPALFEALLPYFSPDYEHAPMNVILVNTDTKERQEKAARQLEVLAQHILALTPSISTSDDSSATDPSTMPSADVALSLQRIASQTRLRWWPLSGHKGDYAKEILEPFSRCLSAYARRSKATDPSSYEHALGQLQYLQDAARAYAPGNHADVPRHIKRTLSSLAQSAGLLEQAIEWTGDAGNAERDGSSQARRAADAIKMGALALEKSYKDGFKEDTRKKLESAIAALAEPLKGDASELASLLKEVSTLRRAAVKLFLGKGAPERPDSAHMDMCLNCLTSCVQFLSRYIGSCPSHDADAKVSERFAERLASVTNIAKAFFDCALTAAKSVVNDPDASWTQFETCLQACDTLFAKLGSLDGAEEREPLHEQMGSPLLKISNLYWSWYTRLKSDTTATVEDKCRAASRSAHVLDTCTAAVRSAGSQVAKFEKLAKLRKENGQYAEAARDCGRALSTLKYVGVLEQVAELAAHAPLEHVWSSQANHITFRRLSEASQEVAFQRGDKTYVFDNPSWPSEERAVLLECQLDLLTQPSTRQTEQILGSIRSIIGSLLSLYTAEQYPIRRRRALNMAERALPSTSIDLDDTMSGDEAVQSFEMPSDLGSDSGLERYGSHHFAFAELCFCLEERLQDNTQLERILAHWNEVCAAACNSSDLSERIDRVDRWLALMKSLVTLLGVQSRHMLQSRVLEVIAKAQQLDNKVPAADLVTTLTELGSAYLAIGYTGKAGVALVKAKALLEQADVRPQTTVPLHLAHAKYYLTIGDTDKGASVLKEAESVVRAEEIESLLSTPGTSFSTKVEVRRILADARLVYSRLALSCGAAEDALRHAKACVRVNERIWMSLENRGNPCLKEHHSEGTERDAPASNAPFGNVAVSSRVGGVISLTHKSLDLPQLWPVVPSIYEGLTHLAEVYVHQGMYEEAIYHHEQAFRVADAVKSNPRMLATLSDRAALTFQAGNVEKGQDLLAQAKALSSSVGTDLAAIRYYKAAALGCRALEDFDDEAEMLEHAEKMIDELIADATASHNGHEEAALVNGMTKLSLDATKPQTVNAVPPKPTRGRKPAATKTVATKPAKIPAKRVAATKPPAEPIKRSNNEALTLQAVRSEVRREKAACFLLQGKPLEAARLLLEQDAPSHLPSLVGHQIISARQLFAQFMEDIAADIMFNGLPESTISFPAIRLTGRTSESISMQDVVTALSPVKKGQKGTKAKAGKGKVAVSQNLVSGLIRARECLNNAQALAFQLGSSLDIGQMCLLSSQISVLLSAAGYQSLQPPPHPLQSASYFEIPRNQAMVVERRTVTAEAASADSSALKTWPAATAVRVEAPSLSKQFQAEFIDIIPATWSVVSMSINESRDELFVTRYRCGESPFILRLPMGRQRARDLDEDSFSFDDGKNELEQIIELSDYSSRDSRNMAKNGAKAEWWAEREALDERLRDLLINIEHIWLGGFRGIFSPQVPQPELLNKFRKSFEDILGEHVPSRQGRGAAKKVDLDARVLELFVGLGNALDESIDFDEPLQDLVYFVVDILQYNGERNALDEVDFDALVVQTMDALRAYHHAAQEIRQDNCHTIMILDKNLHCFPWESLPSLQSTSISRLPSVKALQERLSTARRPTGKLSTGDAEKPAGHYIPRGGTTILNPSFDLPRTEKTLSPYLQSLPGKWTHLNSRSPSESEFESALATSPALLYFGHGPGSQYIRQKCIKRLCLPSTSTSNPEPPSNDQEFPPRCATTWLMGCSSAHLTSHGLYEPTGTLMSYMTAGAPAVLGMLWDVTDRDCDRFAVRCGDIWGLWEEKEEVEKKGSKKDRKGKGKARRMDERVREGREGKSLDEAVMGSRDACYLRYLNGAAPVVYGIPVYLDY